MKKICFTSIFLISLLMISANLYADVAAEIGVFYDSLSPYGDWIYLNEYGVWVWRPVGLWPDWQPYTYGRWEWSEEYGWIWVSNFEWGWAPFHYGRWFFHSGYGWVWVPGTIWGPHWVVWFYNGPYVGWYPYYPSFVIIDYYSPVVYERVIIVNSGDITSGKYGHNAIPKDNRAQMFGTTSGVHRYIPNENDSNYHNYGPPKAEIEKISNREFKPIKTEFSNMPLNSFDRSNSNLRIFKPDFKSKISDVGILRKDLNKSINPQNNILIDKHKQIPSDFDSRFKPKYHVPLGTSTTNVGSSKSNNVYYRDKGIAPKNTFEYKRNSYDYNQNNSSLGKYNLRNDNNIKLYKPSSNKRVFTPNSSDEDEDDSNLKKTVPKFTPKSGTLPKSAPLLKGK